MNNNLLGSLREWSKRDTLRWISPVKIDHSICWIETKIQLHLFRLVFIASKTISFFRNWQKKRENYESCWDCGRSWSSEFRELCDNSPSLVKHVYFKMPTRFLNLWKTMNSDLTMRYNFVVSFRDVVSNERQTHQVESLKEYSNKSRSRCSGSSWSYALSHAHMRWFSLNQLRLFLIFCGVTYC